jgi:hypothetical protein
LNFRGYTAAENDACVATTAVSPAAERKAGMRSLNQQCAVDKAPDCQIIFFGPTGPIKRIQQLKSGRLNLLVENIQELCPMIQVHPVDRDISPFQGPERRQK